MSVINFIWDELSDNVLMETDQSGATTAAYTNEPGLFGAPISQVRSGSSNFFHYDANGSTRRVTNASQSVTDTAMYTGYGDVLSETGSTTYPFRYKGVTGYYSDEGTGEICVRARTYDPGRGRWLSGDELGFLDGVNLYGAYFVPKLADPSGETVTCIGCGGSAFFYGGLGVIVAICSDGCDNFAIVEFWQIGVGGARQPVVEFFSPVLNVSQT